MAAFNACLSVGYVANAAAMGMTVHSLEVETTGELICAVSRVSTRP